MAISMLLRDPTMGGPQSINSSLTSIPVFESSRSTCLMACLLIPPCAKASPWPMVLTAKDALVITPTVALVRDATRFLPRRVTGRLLYCRPVFNPLRPLKPNPEEYGVYRAGLEWDLTDPIVIDTPDDFKSKSNAGATSWSRIACSASLLLRRRGR
jgi:hypothetical protein